MQDPHDDWTHVPRTPPTYNPPEVYQPPNEVDKRAAVPIGFCIVCGAVIWMMIIGYVLWNYL